MRVVDMEGAGAIVWVYQSPHGPVVVGQCVLPDRREGVGTLAGGRGFGGHR